MSSTSQVLPATSGVPTAQLTFGKMYRELQVWNPDLDPLVAKRMIQNSYRRIIDYRLWYGLVTKGQITVPTAYTAGNVDLTSGSQTVTGHGTTFTSAMVGRQFRSGFTNPIYTISAYNSATSITLDLPWGGATQSSAGYMIFQNLVSFGNNVKMLLCVLNQRQGYRCLLRVPQEAINIYDTWRSATGWTYIVASYAANSVGTPIYELYPAPTYQQVFPFLLYIQPPDLGLGGAGDDDTPVVFVRSDVVVLGALPDALTFRRNSPYYNPQLAQAKNLQYKEELQKMGDNDDNSLMKNYLWDYSKYPFAQYGAQWLQNHDGG